MQVRCTIQTNQSFKNYLIPTKKIISKRTEYNYASIIGNSNTNVLYRFYT